MQEFLNRIICGDCIEVLSKVREPFADLIFADPPFNIGYKYDKYNDRQKREKYITWTEDWMSICKKVLKPHGSFYIAIGDEYAANVKIIADELNLFMRNWIIWHYTFGQQTKNKFAKAHTHIFYFVNDKKKFVFNDDTLRIISDRQHVYKDKRAYRDGKMPDDVWNEYPRVCGTFDERLEFPCQMPESLLARIIRVSSYEGDWILDPFSGSGTTAAMAAKWGRNYTGIELSKRYVQQARERIRKYKNSSIEVEGNRRWTEQMDKELKWLYHENKVSTEQLEDDDFLITLFAEKFNLRLGLRNDPIPQKEIKKRLKRLRKSGKLGALRGELVRSNGVKIGK
jgi:site-specific DNA-methyltransferase (adenine-specific)